MLLQTGETHILPGLLELLMQDRLCIQKAAPVFVVYASSTSQRQLNREELARGVGLSAPPEQKKPAEHRPNTGRLRKRVARMN